MKCVDASFVIRLVINNEPDNIYNRYWQEWQNSTSSVVAPTLLMYEVSNALYRYQKSEQITQNEAEELLKTASELEIQLYGDRFLHKEALKIASYYNLSATYDAHYLVLAQQLQAELWTADKRLFNCVFPDLRWVKLVSG